jgi:recombination protein RecA
MRVKSNAGDIIVIDSVAALVPKAEVDGEIGDSHVGLQARLMSQALRILNPTIAKTRTCMVFINQIRQKVGVFFGSPETTSGGLALRFYSSVRMDVTRKGYIKKGDEPIGSEVEVKVVKNKVAPPFRKAKFELMFEGGISKEGDVLNLGIEDKLVEKKGNWLYYGDIGLGNGSEKAKEYLRENPALMDELISKILEKRNLLNVQLVERDGEDEEEPEEMAAPAPAPAGRRGRQSASGE